MYFQRAFKPLLLSTVALYYVGSSNMQHQLKLTARLRL